MGLWLDLLNLALIGRFFLRRRELSIRNLDDLCELLILISGSLSLNGSFYRRRGSLGKPTRVLRGIFVIFGSRGCYGLFLLLLDIEDLLITLEL